MFKSKRIYLDHASATPLAKEATRAMHEADDVFANPGGIHADSVDAKKLLQRSREKIAMHLACKAREIVFTSGLTESNALAIVGAARTLERKKRTLKETHWMVSSIEHSSVLECFAEVERMGGSVSHVEPDRHGSITLEAITKALRPETVFVSIGWANNEIGTVQPLADMSRALRAHGKKHGTVILFHSDAGQAPLYRSAQVHTLGVDLLALGSGKLYGPRGIGCLYLSGKAELAPLSFGGGQERGLRSGTEDVSLVAGFAEALDIVGKEREKETKRMRTLRDDFAKQLLATIQGVVVNGDLKRALPHMLNISVPGKKSGEYLVLQMDRAGISLSTKSACREGEDRSHVVVALEAAEKEKKGEWRSRNTLRFSLGRDTSAQDIKRTVKALQGIVPST